MPVETIASCIEEDDRIEERMAWHSECACGCMMCVKREVIDENT
jgi:hypothetical protein